MAETTEPPWVNQSSGTAARNGTTSHTINFGFTSTSGNLLVAIIHGAVTHTVSGWTKQAGPIATGECALFTKTSAGDSSITVTHNGSNYPVGYVIYEFYTGSTVTGVDSTTGSDDTMVALTGLPGTEQVIIGALGRVAVGSETGASISPSAPWVEDADLFTAASGTDGTYLAVVHQINVTSTSITPTISPTYTGTWSNGAREKISAAFDVVPAPSSTPVDVGDAGSAADSLAVAVTSALADTASAADATASTATAQLTDAASSAEVLAAAVAVALADTGAAEQALAVAVAVGLADAGAAVDAGDGDDGSNVPKAFGDTGAASERLRTTTVRPFTGITARPNTGITLRP